MRARSRGSRSHPRPDSVSFLTTANVAKLYGVVYSSATPLATTQVTYNVQTADNTANNYDIGLYSSSGALLAHIGSTAGTTFAPSTGWKTLSWTSAEHHQAGEVLSRDHDQLHQFLRGVDRQLNRCRVYFCGRGAGKRDGRRHAAEHHHDSIRRLYGNHDSNLVDCSEEFRTSLSGASLMTRFLPAVFLLLIASRACGSTVNLSWNYDYTGLAGVQRHSDQELSGPF